MPLQSASTPWTLPVRAALSGTHRERHPSVDVVPFAPATSRGLEGDRQRIEVDRCREAPAATVHEDTERHVFVERLPRPPYERLAERRAAAGNA